MVLELLEGVRRELEDVENCALYAVGTAGDTLCTEVVEVVLKVAEVVLKAEVVLIRCVLLCMLESVEGELCEP